METEELQKKYGQSKQGNFIPIDTIGVPHPYCITPKHLTGDHMYLGAPEIREAEQKHGAVCDICRKQLNAGQIQKILTYDEHKQAILISCKKDLKNKDGKVSKELHTFLLAIKELAQADGFEGFAFKNDAR